MRMARGTCDAQTHAHTLTCHIGMYPPPPAFLACNVWLPLFRRAGGLGVEGVHPRAAGGQRTAAGRCALSGGRCTLHSAAACVPAAHMRALIVPMGPMVLLHHSSQGTPAEIYLLPLSLGLQPCARAR